MILNYKNDIDLVVSRHDEFDEYQADNAKTTLLNLQNILSNKNNIKLYRVLSINDIQDINIDDIGKHYTLSLDNLDEVTLFDIGIDITKKLYYVEIITSIDNIDIDETITANINYPFEQEIYLKDSSNIKILNILPFNLKK